MLVFFHIPKNGGTSQLSELRKLNGISHIDILSKRAIATIEEIEFALKVHYKAKSISGHNLRPDVINKLKNNRDFSKVIILRNPYKRFVSFYKYKKASNKNIKLETVYSWCKNAMSRFILSNTNISLSVINTIQMLKDSEIRVLILENFEKSLIYIKKNYQLELPFESRKKLNRSPKDKEYLDLINNKNLYNRFKQDSIIDFALYDYYSNMYNNF